MKKICFFSGDITREGGTERVAAMVASRLAQEGTYEVLFLSLVEQKKKPFFPLDERIRRFALGDRWIQPGPGYLKILPRLRKFLKEQKPDVIIDIDIVLDVLSIPGTRGLKTKVISWEHFNYFYEQESLYRKWILRYSVKRTDYVITLTEEDRNAYETRLDRKERIRAIYNPMEPEKEYRPQTRENWIVTVGRLIPRKGTDYLARIAPQVLKNHTDWKWYVLGDGEDREMLLRTARENGLEERLLLPGTVSDVDRYLERARLFVMTSRQEGLPMCLLEAKTNRLPCVSFDIRTGPGEIISEGVNGYLIPPFDCEEMEKKIGMLLDDQQLRENMAEQTLTGMEKFRMDAILENWNGVLKQLCECKKP